MAGARVIGGAEFSDDGRYRFKLWRRFKPGPINRVVTFVMLNPSTAGARDDDRTVTRCIDYAERWGYGGIDVVNLFAVVSTEPRALQFLEAPTGDPRCLEALCESVMGAARVVVAWGAHADDHPARVAEVTRTLRLLAVPLHAFVGPTKRGQPRHPLRLAAALPLREWTPIA